METDTLREQLEYWECPACSRDDVEAWHLHMEMESGSTVTNGKATGLPHHSPDQIPTAMRLAYEKKHGHPLDNGNVRIVLMKQDPLCVYVIKE